MKFKAMGVSLSSKQFDRGLQNHRPGNISSRLIDEIEAEIKIFSEYSSMIWATIQCRTRIGGLVGKSVKQN